jgi:hypothetical protein
MTNTVPNTRSGARAIYRRGIAVINALQLLQADQVPRHVHATPRSHPPSDCQIHEVLCPSC